MLTPPNSKTLIIYDQGDDTEARALAQIAMHRTGVGLELVTAFAGNKLQNWLNYSLQGRGCSLQVLQELLLWGFVSWAVTHRVSCM